MKKWLVISGLTLAIGAILLVFFINSNSGGLFANTIDTYSSDVSYRDDARTLPIGTNITYELSRPKSDNYTVLTDDTGIFPLSYEANIHEGTAIIRIKNNDNIVSEYIINGINKIITNLEPNSSYTLEIYIAEGRGNINLMWMEMA